MENQGDALRGRHVQFGGYRQQAEDLQEESSEGHRECLVKMIFG